MLVAERVLQAKKTAKKVASGRGGFVSVHNVGKHPKRKERQGSLELFAKNRHSKRWEKSSETQERRQVRAIGWKFCAKSAAQRGGVAAVEQVIKKKWLSGRVQAG